ncbi:hypothetical protein B0H10DRAFT_1787476 [Mycena sp. CBHHK59/15]|nr:hypothetical protein B0H10DRAFT_1787476 [Mycena sp. CBHHK59/15]
MTPDGQLALFGAWMWRLVNNVVILRKNWRALSDPAYTNLLSRIHVGLAWNGFGFMSEKQAGVGINYTQSDFQTLLDRCLQCLSKEEAATFEGAPIIVGTKVVRDTLNRELVKNFAHSKNVKMHFYHSKDRSQRQAASGVMQTRLWQVGSSVTNDSLGQLPLVTGMKAMVTENIAIKHHVVNGTEGIIMEIKYSTDSEGRRYATCVYVHIPGSGIKSDNLPVDVVPIVPATTTFTYKSSDGQSWSVTRSQLPLLPAYAYTDYKAQGRSLPMVIVDLAGCRGLQSLYVMISRATLLKSLAVLRNFNIKKVNIRLGEDFRNEFDRLELLDTQSARTWASRHDNQAMQY